MFRMSGRIRRVIFGTLLTGSTLFAVAGAEGCSAFAESFVQGFEYGYNHPEVLDELFGRGTLDSLSELA